MLIEPLANGKLIKRIRHIASEYFLARKELFINHKGLFLLPPTMALNYSNQKFSQYLLQASDTQPHKPLSTASSESRGDISIIKFAELDQCAFPLSKSSYLNPTQLERRNLNPKSTYLFLIFTACLHLFKAHLNIKAKSAQVPLGSGRLEQISILGVGSSLGTKLPFLFLPQ